MKKLETVFTFWTSQFWVYFKNRSTHSKLAKFTLGVGAAILLGPIWQPFLLGILSSKFGISAEPTPPIYGLAIIVSGLFFFALVEVIKIHESSKERSEKGLRKRARDKASADLIKAAMSENHADGFLNRLIGDHSYFSEDSSSLCKIEEIVDSADTHFFDTEVADSARLYRDASTELMRFLAYSFFPTNRIDRFVMFPNGNVDRSVGYPNEEQRGEYNRMTKELEVKANNWRERRNDFYLKVNENLV